MNSSKLSIIVCTRNRPILLSQLLFSIENSFLKPRETIIISSGEEISQILKQYTHSLTIKHLHTELVGQSNQKKLAIQILDPESRWVFFLDDDLLLMPNTVSRALEKIIQIDETEIAGIGTQILPLDTSLAPKELDKAYVSKRKSGKILKSGRVLQYQGQVEATTEWLNGASLWRTEVLQQYQLPVLDSRYAAYEDVIFSSNVSKNSELIYVPEIKVLEQIPHKSIKLNLSQFKYISLWTGYLVCSRLDTRIVNYKFLTTFRVIKFLLAGGFLQIARTRKFVVFLKFFSQIISLPMNKSKSKEVIVRLLELESNES